MVRVAIDPVRAVSREVLPAHREGRPARAVVVDRRFTQPVGDVWAALTRPERLARWLRPVRGDLRVRGRYQLADDAGGTVLRCDAPAELAVTWEVDGVTTWVHVHLRDD